MKPVTTAVLVTNIQYATIFRKGAKDGVRVNLAALVIYEDEAMHGHGIARKVRGLGVNSAWPVFDIWLGENAGDPLKFERSDYASTGLVMMHDDGSTTPIAQGIDLKWADGTTIRLDIESREHPIDFETVTDHDGVWDRLWNLLSRKAARYWSAGHADAAVLPGNHVLYSASLAAALVARVMDES